MADRSGPSARVRGAATWRSPVAWGTLLLVAVTALVLDLGTKSWAFRTIADEPVELRYEDIANNPGYRLPWHEGKRVLPMDLLDLHLVINHGAVFGLGDGKRTVFIVFTFIAIVAALFVFARWTHPGDHLAHIAIGLVLAGGLGNLYDRIAYGAVRDFLHMLPRWHLPFGFSWPGGNPEVFPWVFNLADVFLLSGMVLLLLVIQRGERAAADDTSASG